MSDKLWIIRCPECKWHTLEKVDERVKAAMGPTCLNCKQLHGVDVPFQYTAVRMVGYQRYLSLKKEDEP